MMADTFPKILAYIRAGGQRGGEREIWGRVGKSEGGGNQQDRRE